MIHALRIWFGETTIGCITETNSTPIEIYDCYDCIPLQRRSYIKTEENQPVHFTLENPHEANLVFAAIDNCLLDSADPARCDFVLGNFEKLYFVEIKQVKTGRRPSARKDAIRQLGQTIILFKDNLNLIDTDLVAVICLKAAEARPIQTAKKTADRVRFKDIYNASLMEGHSDIF
jgi:hypothetical protein